MKRYNSLREYLSTLKPGVLDQLYQQPGICLAVFRDLPEIAKHYVLRLLFVEHPVTQMIVHSWASKSAVDESLVAIDVLKTLKLWMESPVPGGLPGFLLNETFRNGLKISFLGGGEPWLIRASREKDKHAKTIEGLNQYSNERWEMVLQFMVEARISSNPKERVGNKTVETLKSAGLIVDDDNSDGKNNSIGSSLITSDGFQFLLMDTSSQVWYFMIQYLETVEKASSEANMIECLSFLLQLSFTTLGQVYASDESLLNDNLQSFLQHLREFGLVYQRKRRDMKYYPTGLVINLFSGLRGGKSSNDQLFSIKDKKGYAIVETNYRVYAYTESQLQISLLSIFVEMQYRFPGFCLGVLSRDSVRQALKSGITASQIIKFLSMNSHPAVLKGADHPVSNRISGVPPTICDQIRLWEKERERFDCKNGYLYSEFLCQADFEKLRNYAKEKEYLIWDNPSKKVMVVSEDGHKDVKTFWKHHKKSSN